MTPEKGTSILKAEVFGEEFEVESLRVFMACFNVLTRCQRLLPSSFTQKCCLSRKLILAFALMMWRKQHSGKNGIFNKIMSENCCRVAFGNLGTDEQFIGRGSLHAE